MTDSETKELLKSKFIQYDVLDIAEEYLKKSDMYLYDNDFNPVELPDDDHIKTLTIVKQAYLNGEKQNKNRFKLFAEQIADILKKIPYSQVYKTIEAVCKTLNRSGEYVVPAFGKSVDLLHKTEDDVLRLDSYLSAKYDKGFYSHFFIEALKIGVDETQSRIEALEKATGIHAEEVLYEMYCRNGTLGYLLYPGLYSDPISGIEYLSERFNKADTAHILKHDFFYLYEFKEEGYFDLGNSERRKARAEMIETYQTQVKVGKDMISLCKDITSSNYDDKWNGFILLSNSLDNNRFKYPICPSLHKALVWTINIFSTYI